jgi:hypothetical protein
MTFHTAPTCDPLGPVVTDKSKLDAAKAMDQVTRGQGAPPDGFTVKPEYHDVGVKVVGDFTAPRY